MLFASPCPGCIGLFHRYRPFLIRCSDRLAVDDNGAGQGAAPDPLPVGHEQPVVNHGPDTLPLPAAEESSGPSAIAENHAAAVAMNIPLAGNTGSHRRSRALARCADARPGQRQGSEIDHGLSAVRQGARAGAALASGHRHATASLGQTTLRLARGLTAGLPATGSTGLRPRPICFASWLRLAA